MPIQKSKKPLTKAFGVNEFKLIEYPVQISNVKIARLQFGDARGCSYCFPHGWETDNSTHANRQRNWKKHRKTQWKPTE